MTGLARALAILAIGVAACAPAGGGSAQLVAPDQPPARKIITMADSFEPKSIVETFQAERASGGNNMASLLHDGLTKSPGVNVYEPALAVAMPSIADGSWRVHPDGKMETTWTLRPNLKWHDGQPFTSADLVFTYQTGRDTSIAGVAVTAEARLMDSVSAPDDLTLVIHWSAPYVRGDRAGVGQPISKRLLEDVYQANKETFGNSPLFSTDFVGLGAYRLVKWDRGSSLEAARFDDYYLGRPPFDSIVVRFIIDANALVANILAGAVDVVLSASSSGISVDQAIEVKRRWEGTGNQVLTSQTGSAIFASPQYRPENARPPGTMSDLRVREALLRAIDTFSLTDVMTAGLSPVADSYIHPADPRRAQLESFIAKFPYDPARAQQLLVEAGWNRGPDGVFVRTADNQRLELDFWVRAGNQEKVAAVVADAWTRVGIATIPYIIPAVRRTDREYEATSPGFLVLRVPTENFENGAELSVAGINSAATNWQGLNYHAYVNPRGDDTVNRLVTTIDPRDRLPLEQRLIQEYTSDIALLPLWWEITPLLMVEGIRGPRASFAGALANIFEWDRR